MSDREALIAELVGPIRQKLLDAGITVHEITHTEAAYVVDGSGYERALFVWPFTTADVEQSLRALATG